LADAMAALHPQGELPRQVRPESLLEAIQARFQDYSAIRGWPARERIPFETRSHIEQWTAPTIDASDP
jgi:hypothetical protein